MIKKSGYVALVGRPNVGKSTLLNTFLGEKISITSSKPQTTRWQILGIKTTEDTQFIFIDTPGMHQAEKHKINRYLNKIAQAVLLDADVILFLIDALNFRHEDELVLNKLKETTRPVILVINKLDLLPNKAHVLPLIDQLKDQYPFSAIIPISAKDKENIKELESQIKTLLPEGTLLFPEDQLTDKNERFLIAEIIREKLIEQTEEEIPYTTHVQIEQLTPQEKYTEINAVIWVERHGQKVIIIGKGGARLKKIGMKARKEIERLLSKKVFLRLWVKVKDEWTDDDKALRSLGYE